MLTRPEHVNIKIKSRDRFGLLILIGKSCWVTVEAMDYLHLAIEPSEAWKDTRRVLYERQTGGEEERNEHIFP